MGRIMRFLGFCKDLYRFVMFAKNEETKHMENTNPSLRN